MRNQSLIIALGCAAWLGCNKSEPPAAPAAATEPPVAAAPKPAAPPETPAEVFKNRCVPCHGDSGKGDGPASAALNPKPRNYTDAAWQKTVTDEDLKKAILSGGAAIGKSPIMPAHPDLEAKPELLAGLVKIIRDFAPK